MTEEAGEEVEEREEEGLLDLQEKRLVGLQAFSSCSFKGLGTLKVYK
jgi:hypothetical protein